MCDFICGNVRAEEFDLISAFDIGVIGQADDDLIHGDAADDGMALSAYPYLGIFPRDLARIAIAVSDADGGDASGLCGDVSASVGNAVASGDGAG